MLDQQPGKRQYDSYRLIDEQSSDSHTERSVHGVRQQQTQHVQPDVAIEHRKLHRASRQADSQRHREVHNRERRPNDDDCHGLGREHPQPPRRLQEGHRRHPVPELRGHRQHAEQQHDDASLGDGLEHRQHRRGRPDRRSPVLARVNDGGEGQHQRHQDGQRREDPRRADRPQGEQLGLDQAGQGDPGSIRHVRSRPSARSGGSRPAAGRACRPGKLPGRPMRAARPASRRRRWRR